MAKNDFETVTITGVPSSVKEKLQNIAKNEGTTVSAIMKPHLKAVINSYPEIKRTKLGG